MAKLLLMMAAVVAFTSWAGEGDLFVAAQHVPIFLPDEVSWRRYMIAAQSSEEDIRRINYLPMPQLVTKDPPPCLIQSSVGADICEKDPDYNDSIKQRVLTLLSRDQGVNALLSDPSLRNILNDVMQPKVDTDTVNIRFGGETETPVCSAQETLIYPKRAKTPNEEWVFVLNQENVQQALRVEKCISDGSICGLGMVLPGGAKATCRQKYVYRRMLVLGSNKIEPEEVLMPSCCVCYTTYQGLLLTRIANNTRSHMPGPAVQPMSPSASNMPIPSGPVASPLFSRRSPRRMDMRFTRAMSRPRNIMYRNRT